MQYWDELNPLAMTDVARTATEQNFSLNDIGRQTGVVVLKALLVKFLNSFLDFYNLARRDDAHRIEIVNLLLDEYGHFTLTDLKFFFKQAKKGYFGEVYGRLDGGVIFNWLRKYNHQRMDAFENYQRQLQISGLNEKSRRWQEYAASEAFKENRLRAEEGYNSLVKKLTGSKYGLHGKKFRK